MEKFVIICKIKVLKSLLNYLLHHLSRTSYIVLKVSQLLDFYIVKYQKLHYAPTLYASYKSVRKALT